MKSVFSRAITFPCYVTFQRFVAIPGSITCEGFEELFCIFLPRTLGKNYDFDSSKLVGILFLKYSKKKKKLTTAV